LFVADGTRAETLEKVSEYIGRVREMEPNAAGVVLVNKCDLASEWEVGDMDEVSAVTNGLPSFATSAKTGVNVESAFEALCEQMVSSHG
jgi:signal recognition particle receptor subunit beta